MAMEIKAAIMLTVSIADQIQCENKLTQKPLNLKNIE